MRHKPIIFIVTLLLGFGLQGLQAQESINSSGGNASGSGGTVSYSVGQVFAFTYSNTTGSVAQGVQQAFEISVIIGIEEKGILLSVSAYPNPTTDFLTLSIQEKDLTEIGYQLYDLNGRLLQTENITSNLTNIPMSNLEPAFYLLKVKQQNKDIKVFKILKH